MSTVVRPPDVQGPPPPSGRSRRRMLVALVLVVLLAGAGAAVVLTRSSSSAGSSENVATQSAQPKTDEEKIVEAVKNYYRVDYEAFEAPNEPDPSHPLYPVYAAGPQLQAAIDAVKKAKEQGLAGRHPANSITNETVTVTSIDGDRASIRVCAVDDGIIVRVDTGQPAYDYPPGSVSTGLLTGEMVREGPQARATLAGSGRVRGRTGLTTLLSMVGGTGGG